MKNNFLQIDLIEKSPDKMAAISIDEITARGFTEEKLIEAILQFMGPVSHFLNDDCGVCVVMNGEDVEFHGVIVDRGKLH